MTLETLHKIKICHIHTYLHLMTSSVSAEEAKVSFSCDRRISHHLSRNIYLKYFIVWSNNLFSYLVRDIFHVAIF